MTELVDTSETVISDIAGAVVSLPVPEIAVPRLPVQVVGEAPLESSDAFTVQLAEEASELPEVAVTVIVPDPADCPTGVNVAVLPEVEAFQPLPDALVIVKLLEGLVISIHKTPETDPMVNVYVWEVIVLTLVGETVAEQEDNTALIG